MKILILGANGMTGHLLTIYFMKHGYDVTAYVRRPFPGCDYIIGDAFDTEHLRNIIHSGNYDVIINCIAILNQNAEDHHADAVFLNSYLPHFIADSIKLQSTKLVHISTDSLFAGNAGPYSENRVCDSTSFYGRSKALGEVVDNKNLTFRTCIIGPDINENGIGLFNWFMKQSGVVQGYTGAIWTGVTSLTLAKAIEQSIREGITGLYTLVNNKSISKFELLNLFNRYFRNNDIKIIPDDKLKLDRSLFNSRKDFSFIVPDYEEQIREMYEWCVDNKSLYKHYGI